VRPVFLLLVCVCAAAGVGAGQEAPRPATVRIDAVVTDRAGRPLVGLKAADFELRSGGVVHPIDAVEFRAVTAATIAAPRTFAIFLDEYHVSPANAASVRETMRRFLEEHTRPSDRVVIMKPLDSQLSIDVTSDRDARARAIETFDGRAGDFAPRTPFEAQYLGRAPSAVEAARGQIVTAALRALVTRLGELSSGRAAVAFVSEGFATGGQSQRERRLPDFQTIVRVAARAGVAIYTLDPGGQPGRRSAEREGGGTGGPEDQGANGPGRQGPEGPGSQANHADGIAARMRTLAVETGGEVATGDALAPALARMSRDLDTYYVLTFKPLQPVEGRFFRFELTSTRRDAVVRARSGYWTPVTVVARAAPPPRPPRTLKRSTVIQTWYGVTRLADGRMRLRVTWEPARRVAAKPPREPHTVTLRAARASGASLFEGSISASQLAEVVVPAGRVELDLTIVAADGSVIDREARDLDVPESNASRVTSLPPEIIRARTLREFEAASTNPDAAPTPVREFRRSDRLIVRAPAMTSGEGALTVSARLLNRWGQPMRDLEALDARDSGIVQFSLPLAWLAPGDYEIELRTRDGGSEASQKIPVKVVG
jgi:VWFA-related protein